MIKLSIKFDLSLGKILLCFAGASVAVCAYKFCSSNNIEAVTCYDGEDIIPSELNQSCCTEDKKVKSPEKSNDLVSVDEELFAGRNKLLIDPKIEKNPKIKPAVIYPEPKISPAVSCMNLNEVIKLKEVLETDNFLTRVENKNFKSTENEDFKQVKNNISTQVENENFTQDDFTSIKNVIFTQVENDSLIPVENEIFSQIENDSSRPVKNENFTAVENKSSTQIENDSVTPPIIKNSAPVENKDLNISYVFDENYLKNALLGIFHNHQNFIAVKYHMNELEKVLTQMETTELSIFNLKNLTVKRLKQLQCKTTKHFMFKSHQIEAKAWEIYSEDTKNRKPVHDLKDLKKVFQLINQFYKDTINIFEKTIEMFTLKLNSKEAYKNDLRKFLNNMKKQIDVRLSCISALDSRLVETVGKVKTSFQTSFSSSLKLVPDKENKDLTIKDDLLKSKQIFDSLVTFLCVDRLSNHVLTQQKQLEQTLTDLSIEEATAENYTSLINKRIKQLKEASGVNDLIKEIFKCEITNWTSISKDSFNSLTEFSIGLFEKIKSFYGNLIFALESTEDMKSKLENGNQIEIDEINELIECYDLLLATAKSIENLSYLLILKVVVKLQSELVKIF